MTNYTPPAHLTAATRRWVREITRGYELDSHHWRLLCLAASAWDRAESARAALAEHGLTYVDEKNMPRKRPECAIESDSTIRFCRFVRELGLDAAGTPEAARPPVLRGNMRR